MSDIDVFFQGEGARDVGHLAISSHATMGALKAELARRLQATPDVLLFLEESDEPLDEAALVRDHAKKGGIKVHVHRCTRVTVAVAFNGRAVENRFGPGVTVARVKRWAAEQFGLSQDDASEHVLQLSGSHVRPAPGTHIGSLVSGKDCVVKFDLVADERVNGSPSRTE